MTRADLYETHFNDKMYSSLGFREKRSGTYLAHLSHRLNTLYNCDLCVPGVNNCFQGRILLTTIQSLAGMVLI